MEGDYVPTGECKLLCGSINGDLRAIKEGQRDFIKDNNRAHERLHARIDDLANKKAVSYPIAILITVLSSAVVGLFVAFASKGFK
jgi:hypothetical protein